jgi:putative ABC transport system ATP-binding protein
MALIEVSDVAKIFKMGSEVVPALDGVTVSIEEGELVAITGPSGCGKSTFMNILGLLDQPSRGSYLLDGSQVSSLDDDQRAMLRNQKIGFVFQSFNLLPRATALRNVEMPLVYSAAYDPSFSRAKAREKAAEALSLVGLQERMNHLPSELSGGQRQRVAIARALVNRPRVILADEPTGNLDSKVGAEILKLFFDLNAQGSTVIMVTHDPIIASRVPRVIAMADGRVKEDRRQAVPHANS